MTDLTAPPPTYRVAQWATGNIGTRSLRAVIEHPQMTLVGLHVHSPEKQGLDAGALCGLAPTGVLGDAGHRRHLEGEAGLRALHATRNGHRCHLLLARSRDERGGDLRRVPSPREAWTRPRGHASRKHARRGGTSIHSTGISPGFISEAMPIVLTSIQRRLDRLQIDEFADLSSRNSPEMLFQLMGFGKDPSEFDPRRWSHGAASFGPSLRLIGEAIGLPLDSVESSGEVAVATRDLEIAAGTVPAGTVAAQRMIVAGRRHGEVLLAFSATWYCATDIDADWTLRDGGWRVTVEGDCPLELDIRLAIPLERMAETTPGYTAHRAVNAVPVVCEASPGIKTTVDLPQVVANLAPASLS